MSRQSLNLTPELYEYMLAVSLREPAILKRLREETAHLEEANMQISPEQGQLLQLLVGLLQAKNIIEVGTFTGYSALSMAMAMPDEGKLICCDVNQSWTDIARRYWDEAGQSEKIRLHLAPATETLEGLLAKGNEGKYDIVFIDADKVSYERYYELSLRLLRMNGLMVLDNTLWGGAVIDTDDQSASTLAIRKINKMIVADERVEVSLLPVSDGLTLIRKL